MEIRQLACFVAVAEELHFGRAAQRLGVVQPAVSQQVARLERELGVRLLQRSSRRVALTGDGMRLLAEARSAIAAVERVRTVAAELAAGRSGTLRVGTGAGLGERIRRGVAALRAATPGLAVVLVDGPADAHAAAVRAGELDVALVRGPVRAAGLRAVPLWHDPVHVVLPAGHPLAARSAVPVAALADLVLRLPERRTEPALHDAVLAACRAAGFTPALGRTVRSIEDALVEIGLCANDATVVHSCGDAADPVGVAARPLDPPVRTPGFLLVPADGPPDCHPALTAAFGDAPRTEPAQAPRR